MTTEYEAFLAADHTGPMKRLLQWLNASFLARIRAKLGWTGREFKLLEIGPGRGYFLEACRRGGDIEYSALDRSRSMLDRLEPSVRKFHLPADRIDEVDCEFDMIVAAYVIEHMRDGLAVAEFAKKAREKLKPGGALILLAPDYMRMGAELWNMDHTHVYPTTKRNVNMALIEAGYHGVEIFDITGLLTIPKFDTPLLTWLLRTVARCYSYSLFAFISRPFYRRPTWDIDNVFYRAFCLVKQQNFVVIARV